MCRVCCCCCTCGSAWLGKLSWRGCTSAAGVLGMEAVSPVPRLPACTPTCLGRLRESREGTREDVGNLAAGQQQAGGQLSRWQKSWRRSDAAG